MRWLAVVIAVTVAAPTARADDASDRRQAAEHFALGEAAERREDWKTAAEEFRKAYDFKPHPAPLYKVARNYERLEDWDRAVEYYERYLAEAPDAQDREKVEAKLVDLRKKADAARPRPTATTGLLIVRANVDGAQVIVDGQVVGVTPFQGLVAAGPHEVDVVLAGHGTAHRRVEVPAGGSEQIRENLGRTDGGPGGGASEVKKGGLVLEVSYGLGATTGAVRYIFGVGLRGAGEKIQVGAFLGLLGVNEAGIGLDARYYFATGKVRPYLRGAATWGKASSGVYEETVYGAEVTGGVIFAPFRENNPAASRLEYFVEVGARFTFGGLEEDEMIGSDLATDRVVVPIMFGIVWKFY